MNLLCSLGHHLVYKHTIRIEMESGFDYRGDFIFTNKHNIRRTRGSNPAIKFDPDKDNFYCVHCAVPVPLKATFSRCDNCGILKKQRLIENIGKSLSVCSLCYKQIISYKAFDIFKLFDSSLSRIPEIDIDNFHNYNWDKILELFNGEELENPPTINREEGSENSIPESPVFLRGTSSPPRINRESSPTRGWVIREADSESEVEINDGDDIMENRD